MLIIASKRCKPETLLRKYPNAILADVTSQATDGLKKTQSVIYQNFTKMDCWRWMIIRWW